MLNNYEKKILSSIKIFPIIIIIVFSSIVIYTFISQNNKNFKKDSQQIKDEFVQKQKELVVRDVQLVYDLINYEKNNTLITLKKDIQRRVQEAHDIASNIYNNNKHLNKNQIIQKIKDALRYLKFNNERGYYFIYELNGKNIMLPPQPKLENKNLWDLQDAKNEYTIRNLSKIAKEKTEGFYKWYWYKPNNNEVMYEKIGFVKLFKPLNWFIGTGEYLVDVEMQNKQNVLKRVKQIKYGKTGYVFIINYDGVYINHIKDDLVNKNLFQLKDSNGLELTKEIINTAKKGSGFVEYTEIPNAQIGSPTKKISFIKGFNDWNWAIGSGFYPEDTKDILKEKENDLKKTTQMTLTKIFIIIGIIATITIVLLLIFSNTVKKTFEGYRKRNDEYQNKLQQLLKDKQKKLNDSLETINSYVAMTKTDLLGNITYASDKFCEYVGYTKSELLGNPHSIVRHPDNKKEFYEELWKTIQSGEIFKNTMKVLTKNGFDIWFEILIYPDFDRNQNIIGYTALRIDLTNKKEIEIINKNLELEIKKAVESNRQKDYILSQQSKMAAMGEMLENIAHQWRQPLSVVSAAASGMKLQKDFKELTDEQFYKSINNIINNSKYLSQTIDTFRDFFKSNKEKIVFNLKSTFEKTKKLIGSKYSNNDIEIISDIKDVELFGLESELIQVLMNILNNAKDAFEEFNSYQKKYIFVQIDKDDYYGYIKIKDNAGGIKEEILDKIFDPYFTTKYKSQGTGIGLYMSSEIVSKQMNGSLRVQNQTYTYHNESFKGAEFILSIPLKEKKLFSSDFIKKIEDYNCYKWDQHVNKFIKINLSNDHLVLKNIIEMSELLCQYNIKYKVLKNQDIKVYF